MTHDHHHDHAGAEAVLTASGRFRRRLLFAFAITATLAIVQAVTAVLTGSLALLSDTAHMVTDVVGLGMALTAVAVSQRTGINARWSFGLYRLEVLAALANAVLLTAVGVYAVVEALRRFGDPPEVPGLPLLLVASAGLAANLLSAWLLREGARESLTLEGAYLEVIADLLGSLAVVTAAVLILATGWGWVDPAIGALVGVVVLPRAWRLGGRSLAVLLQSAPRGADPAAIRADLATIDGVVDVHDLHVWTLTSGLDVASAHVMIAVGVDPHAVLDQARDLLAERHDLHHATLQVEPQDHRGCAEMAW